MKEAGGRALKAFPPFIICNFHCLQIIFHNYSSPFVKVQKEPVGSPRPSFSRYLFSVRFFAKFAVAPSVSAEGNRCSSPDLPRRNRGAASPVTELLHPSLPFPSGCAQRLWPAARSAGSRLSQFLHFLFLWCPWPPGSDGSDGRPLRNALLL